MRTFLRRCFVFAALMFWQGGFTFYAAVVVPVGQEVLGSHLDQGFITREVTRYLNWSGVVALIPLFWDLLATHDENNRRKLARWLCWVYMLGLLGVLVWLHQYLDSFLDAEEHQLLHRSIFRSGHRWYLWLSTFQWGLSLLYAGLTLQAWRAEDRATGA